MLAIEKMHCEQSSRWQLSPSWIYYQFKCKTVNEVSAHSKMPVVAIWKFRRLLTFVDLSSPILVSMLTHNQFNDVYIRHIEFRKIRSHYFSITDPHQCL